MSVERQVVAGDREARVERDPEAGGHLLAQRPRMEVPEEPVMDEQELGARAHGALEQLAMGGDAGGDLGHLDGARDLKPVRPVVLPFPSLEQLVAELDDLLAAGRHDYDVRMRETDEER